MEPIKRMMERYLAELEKELFALPTSERAEILTEMKGHLLEKRAQKEMPSYEAFLKEVGTPQAIAKEHLEARGIFSVPKKEAPRGSVWKWIFLILGGGILVSLALGVFLIYKASTWVQDFGENSPSNMGKAIMTGIPFMMLKNMRGAGMKQWRMGKTRGSWTFPKKSLLKKPLQISVQMGKAQFQFVSGNTLTWDCKGMSFGKRSFKERVLELGTGDCKIRVPKHLSLQLQAWMGEVSLEKPMASLKVHMSMGTVRFRPDAHKTYRYQVDVGMGTADPYFQEHSNHQKGAIPIDVSIQMGTLEKF